MDVFLVLELGDLLFLIYVDFGLVVVLTIDFLVDFCLRLSDLEFRVLISLGHIERQGEELLPVAGVQTELVHLLLILSQIILYLLLFLIS